MYGLGTCFIGDDYLGLGVHDLFFRRLGDKVFTVSYCGFSASKVVFEGSFSLVFWSTNFC